MSGKQKMTALQLRKQSLLLESDLNRLTLLVEGQRLREVGSWTARLAGVRSVIGPAALLVAPVAGLALALSMRRSSSGGGFWKSTLQMAPSLIRLWRAWVKPAEK